MGRVSTVHLVLTALFCLSASVLQPSAAAALELKPFKDDLFAYPGIMESKDNGDWIKVDYRKERDIYERDDVPERKVKWQYVSQGVTWHQSFDTVDLGAGASSTFHHRRKIGKQKFSVVFIHGRGVDRKLGASDERFGGNFNRLKKPGGGQWRRLCRPNREEFRCGGRGRCLGVDPEPFQGLRRQSRHHRLRLDGNVDLPRDRA